MRMTITPTVTSLARSDKSTFNIRREGMRRMYKNKAVLVLVVIERGLLNVNVIVPREEMIE